MIPIPASIGERIAFLHGSAPASLANAPRRIFATEHVDFLAELSRTLLADAHVRTLPDVVAFAFWCRASNLRRMAEASAGADARRVGLGLTVHVCPANVPVNFAYSLAFGLLAGNNCVVRLPSAPTPTADFLVAAIGELLTQQRWSAMRDAVVLVRHPKDDTINAFWSQVADGRIVWGGDATVTDIRRHRLAPRAREIAFADRYSLCVLGAAAVLHASPAALAELCEGLYRDIYLNDQAACSSPQLVVWLGDADVAEGAKKRLWDCVLQHADARYAPEPVELVDKFTRLCEKLIDEPAIGRVDARSTLLYRLELESLSPRQSQARAYFGTVQEIVLDTLEPIAEIVDPSWQTITYFGVDPSQLGDFVVAHRLRGIDRIVPAGRALDLGLTWDGYDIVGAMSRIIHVE